MAKAFDRDLLARVRRDQKINAWVRALGGWEHVNVIEVEDLRANKSPRPARGQLYLGFKAENLNAGT